MNNYVVFFTFKLKRNLLVILNSILTKKSVVSENQLK